MKITNQTIEEIINILNDPQSFRNNIDIKIPAVIRFAIRVNEEKITSLYKAYVDERVSLLRGYVDNNKAALDGERIKVAPEYITEATKELTDLAIIVNEVDFHTVDKETMDAFLNSVELSVPEERILLMFVD